MHQKAVSRLLISVLRRLDLEIGPADRKRTSALGREAISLARGQVNPVPPFANPAKDGAPVRAKANFATYPSGIILAGAPSIVESTEIRREREATVRYRVLPAMQPCRNQMIIPMKHAPNTRI